MYRLSNLFNRYFNLWVLPTLLMGCQTTIEWKVDFENTGTYASPRAIDLNQDQVLDLVIGAGGRVEWDSTPNGVLALNGKNGKLLWHKDARNQIIGCPVFTDLNEDQVPDVIIGGRSAQLMALDGRDGTLIWEYLANDPSLDFKNDTSLLNFFNPQLIDDQNQDGFQDILIAYGGFVKAKPWETIRPSGYLMIFSALDGKLIIKAPMPDGKETYMSPVVDVRPTETLVYFGSGGETIAGNFYVTRLEDVLDGTINEHQLLIHGTEKGFIAPPLLIDITNDKIPDVVVNAYQGKTTAIDGADRKIIWQVDLGEGYETHSQPAPGHFSGNDSIVDFFVNYGQGIWPEVKSSLQLIIDGKTGHSFRVDSLGSLQYGSPIVLENTTTSSNDVFLLVNEIKETNFSPESGRPQKEFTNSLLVFTPQNNSVKKMHTLVGTNIGSTLLAEDLDQNGELEIICINNQNPYDPFIFSGMQIRCITLPGYESHWNQYMGPQGKSIYRD